MSVLLIFSLANKVAQESFRMRQKGLSWYSVPPPHRKLSWITETHTSLRMRSFSLAHLCFCISLKPLPSSNTRWTHPSRPSSNVTPMSHFPCSHSTSYLAFPYPRGLWTLCVVMITIGRPATGHRPCLTFTPLTVGLAHSGPQRSRVFSRFLWK